MKNKDITLLQNTIEDLLEQVSALREALEFYADRGNYVEGEVESDAGSIAREALGD